MRTKCVLEVLQNNNYYCSLRTAEAYVYKKKLLTTNAEIINRSFYNKDIVRIIDNTEDLDIDFIQSDIKQEVYDGIDFWTIKTFKNFLKDIVG